MKRIEIKIRRKMCASCHRRRARFMWAGRVKWDRFHSLCFVCYRSSVDRLRAALAAAAYATMQDAAPGVSAVPSPLPPYIGASGIVATAETAQAAA